MSVSDLNLCPARDELLFKRVVILDDAVVDDGDFAGGVKVRMELLSDGTPCVAQRVWRDAKVAGDGFGLQQARDAFVNLAVFLAQESPASSSMATPALS